MKYKTTITGTGILSPDLLKTNTIILFEDTAKDVFIDFGTLHSKAELKDDIEVGDTLKIGDQEYTISLVEKNVNKNLRESGHTTIQKTGDDAFGNTNVIFVDGPSFPSIENGTVLEIE